MLGFLRQPNLVLFRGRPEVASRGDRTVGRRAQPGASSSSRRSLRRLSAFPLREIEQYLRHGFPESLH